MTFSNRSDLVEVFVDEVIMDNPDKNAVWFRIDDRKIWVPRSLMEDWPDEGDQGIVEVKEWFAEREGLI
jgi:hypothetical protein